MVRVWRLRSLVLPLAAWLLGLALYIPRTCRTLTMAGDSAELVTAAALWGVPHPPGYPLWTLVGHAFGLIPIGDLAFRVHLSSTLFHATTVMLVVMTVRSLTDSRAAAATAGAALALSGAFFSGSLYAEVFPLNDCLFALALFFGVRLGIARSDEKSWQGWAFALSAGLLVGNHPLGIMAAPALVLLAGDRFSARWIFVAAAPVVAMYLLVPLAAARHPYLSWGDVHDAPSLLRLLTRQDYGGWLHASRRPAEGQLLERLDAFTDRTVASFGVVATLLGFAGWIFAWRSDRRRATAVMLAFLMSGPLVAALNAIDLHSTYRMAFFARFTTMSHVAWAVAIGWGVSAFERLPRWRGTARIAVPAAAVLPLVWNARALDMSEDRLGLRYAHDLVLETPPDSLVLLKGDMPGQAALYVCGVERACGDRVVLSPGQLALPWKLEETRRRHSGLELPPHFAMLEDLAALVAREVRRRPVLVHPELLDDAQGPLVAVPAGLLFRLYPDQAALELDLATVRAELAAPDRPPETTGSPLDSQVVRAYEIAERAREVALRELFARDH